MTKIIIVDELALKELVESNIYQSQQFVSGEKLALALLGEQSIEAISPKIHAIRQKEFLYLLLSRSATGYLIIDPTVFQSKKRGDKADANDIDDMLNIFQRVCRFALKQWNRLSFSHSEMWSASTQCGVVFPFPKSRADGFRVSIKVPEIDTRIATRHGSKLLFAFASGRNSDSDLKPGQVRDYRRSFEILTSIRSGLEQELKRKASLPSSYGATPLVLTTKQAEGIVLQDFDKWFNRLTKSQYEFVTHNRSECQRVEGPAGTGKTLCLLLRAFYLCRSAENSNKEMRLVFVSHSEATKNSILLFFDALGDPFYHRREPESELQFISVCTLQEWCGGVLGSREVSNAQYLDQDALTAKEMRLLMLTEIIQDKIAGDNTRMLDYLSSRCREFFTMESLEYLAEMIQHEIAIMIKGRAGEDLESYLSLPKLSYGVPVANEADRRFLFSIYNDYQKELNSTGVFDTDDIVLSALGRLDTPIWRRRREREGYDAVIIDETHLFNFNELSLFHFLLRSPDSPQIVFSIDRSQAPGDRGLTSDLLRETLTSSGGDGMESRTNIVFRCSPAIVRLAEAVTSAGATLFTIFENPLVDAASVISASDESAAGECIYWECDTDEHMILLSMNRAKDLASKLKCGRAGVLIVAMTNSLLKDTRDYMRSSNFNFVEIASRGDLEAVNRGHQSGAFVLSHPDFVGGLEFTAVILIGTGDGRVPPKEGIVKTESRHFVQFKACNRLYVAISRARLQVELAFTRERGPSPLLQHAIKTNAIEKRIAFPLRHKRR